MNWKDINPDIFGSMVQSVATEDNRSHLGMHYTSVPNIMKVIRPLFLDELNKTFEDIILLSDRLEQQRRLNNLRYRISKIKFFDPASGSGNFLIITYKEIRRLEIKIMQTQISLIEKSNLQERNKVKQIRKIINSVIEINLLNPDEKSCVHLGQFYGIEIDPFAHEVARLSLWIAEHQMNMELMSVIPNAVRPTLPLQKVGDIRLGNALQIDWQEFLPHKKNDEIYIFGNPPYKGSTEQNNEQKSDMEHVFKKNYKRLDYIAAWFELASRYIATSKASFAFVTTNSINQGTQVSTLWPLIFQRDLEIFFAVPSFKWKNSAKNKANVIVSIVGMRSLTNENKKIYRDNEVSIVRNINAYLVPHDNFIIRRRTKSISSLPALIVGNRPNDGGGLIFSISEYNESINRFPELNSIFSKFIGGKEFTNNTYRYILWMSDSDAKIFKTNPIIKERLKKVSETRNKKNIGLTLAPWQLQNVRNEELMGLFIPQSSSSNRDYLPMGLIDKDVKISDPNFVLYNPELWLVGTLMSRMHMVWIKVISGKLKSDYRYSVEMVYNTFPIPIFSTQRKNEVDRVVRDIFDLREEYGLTLSELYNNKTMPRDLRVLHERLDGIVERAYRQTPFKDDQERLGVLLNMYKEMTKDD
ncbi:class I SAM-dependent DNA methyltransferase [Latilactobacillus sakei]|uniref:class I SAM-dependent DNA methyltransferase n=1 Tax=Latilactobacillus sakei TaxID=1599 RepID=UPI0035B5857D